MDMIAIADFAAGAMEYVCEVYRGFFVAFR